MAEALYITAYPGSKRVLCDWLASHLPGPADAQVYVEPFCGMASYLLSQPCYQQELINDSNLGLYSLFKTMQDPAAFKELEHRLNYTLHHEDEFRQALQVWDDPAASEIDRAWGILVKISQSFGAKGNHFGYAVTRGSSRMARVRWGMLQPIAERLQKVQVFNRDFERLIDLAIKKMTANKNLHCIIYCDPPYPEDVASVGIYQMEFAEGDQERFLAAVRRAAEVPNIDVAVSSYPNGLYDSRLHDWRWEDTERNSTMNDNSNTVPRKERLYMSYDPYKPMLDLWDH